MSLADEYGEDPARFLARAVPSSLETMQARIRGIQTIGEIRDWIQCEAAIGPRKQVIAALNQRKIQLQGRDESAPETEGVAD